MPLKVTITTSGLITYQLLKDQIDAIIPATRRHASGHAQEGISGHAACPSDHGTGLDPHLPALVLPLAAFHEGTAAPDQVFDAGKDEFGLWRLDTTIVDVWRDGVPPPKPDLDYENDAEGKTPKDGNDGDLHWLANLQKAAANSASVLKQECLPPKPNPDLTTAVVRMLEGKVVAYWTNDDSKRDVWDFENALQNAIHANVPPPYVQALAEGIEWTFDVKHYAEIRLTSTLTGGTRSLYLKPPNLDAKEVSGTISHKPSTVGGASVIGVEQSGEHFAIYYDLVHPVPGPLTRRVPVLSAAATKTNRCPGSAA